MAPNLIFRAPTWDPSWGGLGSAWAAKSNFLEAQLRGAKNSAKNSAGNNVLALVGLLSPAASPAPRGQI